MIISTSDASRLLPALLLLACGGTGTPAEATSGAATETAAAVAPVSAESPAAAEAAPAPTGTEVPGGAAEPPGGPEASPVTDEVRRCAADADCVLSTFPGCCSCCVCAPLYAIRADAEKKRQDTCAARVCPVRDCAGAACAPCGSTSPSVRARCAAGLCAIAP